MQMAPHILLTQRCPERQRGRNLSRCRALKARLDRLYERYNRREFVHPDPLEFLYGYSELPDREVVALLASSLAYGRVAQILRSASWVLGRMGPEPHGFLTRSSEQSLQRTFADFRHRFTTGEHLIGLLIGIKRALGRHGSLGSCFAAGFDPRHHTLLPAVTAFVDALSLENGCGQFRLLPSPRKGSACKRVNLFLRWMVRQDAVDPGGWSGVPPTRLIIPLDTHMHRICLKLGLTRRKQANLRTALEVTAAFRTIAPDDPVRYDFSLTRLGIRRGLRSSNILGAFVSPE
jgi:uncharacterized protein (TIGR02757 family)